MKTARLTPVILLCLLIGAKLYGAVDPSALSLMAALKKGLEYSPDLKKAESQVKGAESDTSKARGLLFPTINGVASATNTQNSTTLTTNNTSGFSSSNGDTYQVGLTLSQPLYAGGALTSGLNFYKASEDLARQNYFSIKQTAVLNILTAYYSLAQAHELYQAAISNRNILKSYVDITNHYEKIGRSRKMDQLQAQVNYSLALADVENLQNNEKTAVSNINRYLGEAADKGVTPDFRAVVSPIGSLTLEQAFDAALKSNPDIRTAQVKLEQVSYSEDLDLALDKPSLTLTGTDGYRSPDTSTLWNSTSNYYSVGLNLTVPIFTGFSSFAKRSGYQEKKYQAERDLQIAKDTLHSGIENQLHTLKSAQVQLELAQHSVKEGRDALEMANKSYRQGTASSVDVVNLQTTRYNAEKLFVNSQFAYLQALLTLRQQMGIDLEKAYDH